MPAFPRSRRLNLALGAAWGALAFGVAASAQSNPPAQSDPAHAPAAEAREDNSASPSGETSSPADDASSDARAAAPPARIEQPEAAELVAEGPIEVTVVGTSVAKTAGSAHIINERKLERFEYDDSHQVLGGVPGTYSRGEDALGLRPNISLRGVNPDRSKKVALLEDGIPFAPAPYSAPAAYYFPLITRFPQVAVIKGPAAISYGPQTVAGAIDLRSRGIPATTTGSLDLAFGQYGYGKAHGWVGSSNESIGFLIEGVHLRSDGFKELPDGADTGFYRNEWMFKGSYQPDVNSRVFNQISLKLAYADEASNETYLGLSDADYRDNPLRRYGVSRLDRMTNHRTAVTLGHRIEPTANSSLTTNVYRHDFFRIWRRIQRFRGADLFDVLANPETPRNAVFYDILSGQADSASPSEALLIGPNQRAFVAQGIQTKLEYRPQTGPVLHRIEYGMRLHYDRVERRHSEDGYRVNAGELVPEGGPSVVTAFNEASTQALALHAVDAMTWGRLTLTPGVRFEAMRFRFVDRANDRQSRRLANAVLPGVGAFYGLTDSLGLLAGVYRGFSPPVPESGVETAPELSVNYELGARFSRGALRAELIGFYNDYSNLTDICTFSSGCLGENLDRQFDAGEARVYGLEAYATDELPLASWKLPWSIAYTLTYSEFANSFTSDDPIYGEVAAGDEIPYVPRHHFNASLGIENERIGAVAAVDYVSPLRELAGSEPLSETLATDRLLVVDVGAKYRVWPALLLYLNVRNLFDDDALASRRPFGARPIAPRWLQIGAKYAF